MQPNPLKVECVSIPDAETFVLLAFFGHLNVSPRGCRLESRNRQLLHVPAAPHTAVFSLSAHAACAANAGTRYQLAVTGKTFFETECDALSRLLFEHTQTHVMLTLCDRQCLELLERSTHTGKKSLEPLGRSRRLRQPAKCTSLAMTGCGKD